MWDSTDPRCTNHYFHVRLRASKSHASKFNALHKPLLVAMALFSISVGACATIMEAVALKVPELNQSSALDDRHSPSVLASESAAQSTDECTTEQLPGFCLHIANTGNTKYLYFYASIPRWMRPGVAEVALSHWNVKDDSGSQHELHRLGMSNRSNMTRILSEPGSSHLVQVQLCLTHSFSTERSSCGPWHTFTLVHPATHTASIARNGLKSYV